MRLIPVQNFCVKIVSGLKATDTPSACCTKNGNQAQVTSLLSHWISHCKQTVRSPTNTHFTMELAGGCLKYVFALTDLRRACPRGVIGSMVGAYPRGTGSNPVEGNELFFPSYRQPYLSSFSDTLLPTQRRSLQMLDVAVPQIGVQVFHAWLFHDGAGEWVSEVFVSTDARHACPRSVIGSTMGAYPRGTGRIPSRGMGTFPLIPSALSFVFLWHIL